MLTCLYINFWRTLVLLWSLSPFGFRLICITLNVHAVADPSRRQGHALPTFGPNSFIFMQFAATILQNNRLPHSLWSRRHPPTLGNSGSATVMCHTSTSLLVAYVNVNVSRSIFNSILILISTSCDICHYSSFYPVFCQINVIFCNVIFFVNHSVNTVKNKTYWNT